MLERTRVQFNHAQSSDLQWYPGFSFSPFPLDPPSLKQSSVMTECNGWITSLWATREGSQTPAYGVNYKTRVHLPPLAQTPAGRRGWQLKATGPRRDPGQELGESVATARPCPVPAPHGQNSRARRDLCVLMMLPDPFRSVLWLLSLLGVSP